MPRGIYFHKPHRKEQKKKISISLKRFYSSHIVWNKGKTGIKTSDKGQIPPNKGISKFSDIKKHRREHHKKYRENNLNTWNKIIPTITRCQICGVDIYFNRKNKSKAIHFDHRHGEHDKIKAHPIEFLRRSPCNQEREKIWREADLGMLCKSCNSYLPTKNRKEYIKKVIIYVFGADYAQHL